MKLYLWVPYSKEFVICVYLCNSLHEARGRPGGLAWGQIQLWILSQVRVTLSPHYSLTWPHHYHSNSVNHDDSYALFSLSFIISTHRKVSCFSVFLGRESLKTPPTQEVHMRKMKVVMVTKCNQQKKNCFVSCSDSCYQEMFSLCRLSVSSNEGMTIWSSAFENLLRIRLDPYDQWTLAIVFPPKLISYWINRQFSLKNIRVIIIMRIYS